MIGNALYTVRPLFFLLNTKIRKIWAYTLFKTVPYRLSLPLHRDCLFRNDICRNSVAPIAVTLLRF